MRGTVRPARSCSVATGASLIAVAYRLLGHEQDALDAVQDGFLKAVTHLDDFEGRSGFQTWLMRIVTHAALDSGRKRGRRATLSLGDRDGNSLDPACQDDPCPRLVPQ